MENHAILIGVNETNSMHFGVDNLTPTASGSTRLIADFLEQEEYSFSLNEDYFVGSKAIWNDVRLRLQALAKRSHEEKLFLFFYFCGHGYNYVNREKVQTFLCFYDQMVFENELINTLHQFHKSCKVFMVVDSCYAEGLATNKKLRDQKTFGMVNPNRTSYPELIDFYKKKLRISRNDDQLPSIFFIASVGEKKWANTGSRRNGEMFAFSSKFLSQLEKNGSERHDYFSFFDQLEQQFSESKKPKLRTFDTRTNYFKNNKPLIT